MNMADRYKINAWLIFCVSAMMAAPGPVSGQKATNHPTKKFHVSSIKYDDNPDGWCGAGTCTATKISLTGFLKSSEGAAAIRYKLSCITVVPTPAAPANTVFTVCPVVHANKDYPVEFYGLHQIDFLAPEEVRLDHNNDKWQKSYALFDIEAETE